MAEGSEAEGSEAEDEDDDTLIIGSRKDLQKGVDINKDWPAMKLEAQKGNPVCVYCNNRFKSLGTLRKHVKGMRCFSSKYKNTGPRRSGAYACNVCEKRFGSEEKLRSHHDQGKCKGPKPAVSEADKAECTFCNKVFPSSDKLKNHHVYKKCPVRFPAEQSHSRLDCEHCGSKFSTSSALGRHLKASCRVLFPDRRRRGRTAGRQPNEEPDTVCDICGRKMSSITSLIRHKFRKHGSVGDRGHQCPTCGRFFPRLHMLKAHMLYHNRPFKCTQCGKAFASKAYLIQHKLSHLEKRAQEVTLEDVMAALAPQEHKDPVRIPEIDGDEERPRPFECDRCEKTFMKAIHLTKHKEVCKGLSLEERARDILEKFKAGGGFQCVHCGRMFRKKPALIRHQYKKHLAREHKCTECGKMFGTEGFLREHFKTHTRPYVCDLCGQSFCSSSNMNKHKLQRCEFSENRITVKYACSMCPRQFSTQQYLDGHMKARHAGKKDFQCDWCGKYFTYESGVKIHKERTCKHRDTSQDTEVTLFQCEVCSRVFKSKALCKQHMQKHNPPKYSCPYCYKGFVWHTSYSIHVKCCPSKRHAIISGVKPTPEHGGTTLVPVKVDPSKLEEFSKKISSNLGGTTQPLSEDNQQTVQQVFQLKEEEVEQGEAGGEVKTEPPSSGSMQYVVTDQGLQMQAIAGADGTVTIPNLADITEVTDLAEVAHVAQVADLSQVTQIEVAADGTFPGFDNMENVVVLQIQ